MEDRLGNPEREAKGDDEDDDGKEMEGYICFGRRVGKVDLVVGMAGG